MKRMLNKIIALIILIELAGINFLADAVYASNAIIEGTQSKKDGIVFQANINNSNNTEANIDEENNLNIKIALNSDGFLKDVRIVLKGNNYEISKSADEINENLMGNTEITNINKIIKSIESNEINLKEVDKGEELNVVLPIKFVKNERVSKENLESDSTITMIATYVNGQNKESQEVTTINQHLKWAIKAEEEVSQKIVRYLKYDNRTMVSFEVIDAIKENKIPVDYKEISIQVPTINNEMPEVITVVGEGIEKELINGVLKITKRYKANQADEYDWNSENKFTVTYIYKEQTDSTKVVTSANAKVTTILGDVIQANSLVKEYDIDTEVGSVVQLETTLPKELSKGYIYTNLNRPENKLDTTFNVNHKVNIGLTDLVDKIVLEEESIYFNNEDKTQSADVTNYVLTNKVGVLKEEIENVLGENGKIIVKDSNLNEIGVLDKDNNEIEVNANNLIFEISKPEKEGLINIYEIKALTGNTDFSVDDLLTIKSLSMNSIIYGYNENNTISSDETVANTKFVEPTSNASVDVNTDSLSTVTDNKDIVINVVLETSDINDSLYVDPIIRINFPEEVTGITPKSAKIVYDDKLLIDQIETQDRSLIFNLKGVQNEYNTLETTKGTLLQVVVDIKVNNLVPSNLTKISVDYTNQFNAEAKTIEKNINIVAPNGMITTNQIDIDDTSLFTMSEDLTPLLVKSNDDEKEMQISGQIINNTGDKVDQVSIVGRIPSTGNKTIGGTELESTFNTILKSEIEVEGFNNYVVLYSNNIEENIDGNGWTEYATSDSKSYKIVLRDTLEDKMMGKFSYRVYVPKNIGYEQATKQNYGVYYNINSEEGSKQYLTESKVLGIQTGLEPSIKMGVSAIDTNKGYSIGNNEEVQEGQYISYRLKVSNTGSVVANDVFISAQLKDGLTLIIPEEFSEDGEVIGYKESPSKTLLQSVGTLQAGASVTYEFTVRVDKILTENEKNSKNTTKLTVGFAVAADILGEEAKTLLYSLNCKPGYFGLKLSSDVAGIVEANKDIKYELLLTNANYDDKTNSLVKVKLPKNVVYSNIDEKYEKAVKYDKKQNILTINLDTVKGNAKEIISFTAKNMNYEQEKLSTEAEVTCDGLDGSIKSNSLEFISEDSKSVIKAIQGINKNELSDEDEIEFYTDITNYGIGNKVVNYKHDIAKELGVIEYKVMTNGTILDKGNVNYINEVITLAPKSTVRVIVRAKAYPIDLGNELSFNLSPTITLEDGTKIEVEQQTVKIVGTADSKSTTTTNEGEVKNSKVGINEKKHRITGNVWLENYADGARGTYDDVIEGVKMLLFNSDVNQVVLNDEGEEVSTYTDEQGNYQFKDVKPGNYYIVAMFDNIQYEIVSYRADNVDESLNSDFVTAILNDKVVAATEVVSVSSSNINNVDLGLIKKDIFDLAINQTIDKISIISKEGTRLLEYDSEIANLELSSKELEGSTLVVEYNIKVYNTGNVAGYAKSILDYIPTGMTFNSQMNPDWYQTKDGVLHCVSLADEIIQPGQSVDIKVILSKKNENNELGLTRGKAEIGTTYTIQGLTEISALSKNVEIGGRNVTSSRVVTVKKSGVKAISVILISIAVVGLIGFTGFEVKKRVFDKLYNIDDIE